MLALGPGDLAQRSNPIFLNPDQPTPAPEHLGDGLENAFQHRLGIADFRQCPAKIVKQPQPARDRIFDKWSNCLNRTRKLMENLRLIQIFAVGEDDSADLDAILGPQRASFRSSAVDHRAVSRSEIDGQALSIAD